MPICTRDGFYNGPSNNREFFRDDEEVFFCEITKEIFRDYEEYFRHITAINSTVWRCELTGKDNLTYAEALKSERRARKKSDEFKEILKPPTMLVIEEAKQSSLNTLTALTCQFLRKRYFKNEDVQITTMKSTSPEKNQYTVIDIISSNNQLNLNGVYKEPEQILYKLKSTDNKLPEIIQPFEKIRRQRYEITLEKVQMFIKNNTVRVDGILRPNPEAYKKYVIDRKITFESIFIGKMPEFTPAKVPKQLMVQKQEPPIDQEKLKAEKRAKLLEKIEEECTALLTKTDDLERTDQRLLPTYTPVKMFLPAKLIGDAFMLKEFFHNFSSILSNINVFKERVTMYELSRALSIREVAGPLSDIILILLGTIFDMQRDEEEECIVYYVRGVQKDEPNRTMSLASKTHYYVKRHFSFKLNQLPLDATTVSEVVRLHFLSSGAAVANSKAERWRIMYRNGYTSSEDPGLELRLRYPYILRALKLYTIYQLPFRDIMRIIRCLMDQILTYSASINFVEERCEQVHNLLVTLKNAQTVENQRLAKVQTKKRIIMNQFNQQCMNDNIRKDTEKRKELEATLNKELGNLITQSKKEQNQYEQQSYKLTDKLFELLTYLGMDRAYRRYYVLNSIPGLFIEHDSDCKDCCLENAPKNNIIHNDLTAHNSNLPKTRKELRAYLTRMYNEKDKIVLAKLNKDENGKINSNQPQGGNKENQLNGQVNGITSHYNSNGNKVDMNDANAAETVLPPPSQQDLFMCTGDSSNCLVHGDGLVKSDQVRWSYLYKKTDLDGLLDSLNPLGLRESELRKQLTLLKNSIERHLRKCPIEMLNVQPQDMDKFHKLMMSDTHRKYNNANCGFSIGNSDLNNVMYNSLIERILQFESDIYTGDLGRLKVKDMEKWRKDLLSGNYDPQVKLQWGPFKQTNAAITSAGNGATAAVAATTGTEGENGAQGTQSESGDINDAATNESDNDGDEETVADDLSQYSMKPYNDPGNFLGETVEIDSTDSANDGISLHESPSLKSNVKQLASALLQVEQAIELRFLKEPFGPPGNAKTKEFHERMKQRAKNRLRQWEVSLMESSSYSQVFLHLNILHDCIIWARSTNKSNCMICRRYQDPEKMLLCDECNGGTHMYCMKPIMKTVPEGNWYCKRCVARLGLKNGNGKGDNKIITTKKRAFIIDESASSDTSSVKSQLRERISRHRKVLQPNVIEQIIEEEGENEDEEDDNTDENSDEDEPDDNVNDYVTKACDVMYVENNIDNNSKENDDNDDNDDSGNMSNSNDDESTCCVCSHEGSELACTQCKNSYHLECINLKRPPRYNFICNKCKSRPKEYSRKRKSQSISSDSDSNENENYVFTTVVGTKRSKRHSNNNNNNNNSGSNNHNRNNNDNDMGSGTSRRSYRRTGDNLPLNNSALYELLEKVMKNEHAWPFLRPVSQAEVPDYYDIIKNPMDFAKVKSKLNMGSYQINEEVMRDIELIFSNCDEYNVKGNEIYQNGAALEKLVIDICKELHLPFKASDMNEDD